jgi:ABC-type bacteriocin/lantibiotic exporter with double-glycine peptidase domain
LKLIESLENIEQLEGDPTPLDLKHIGFTPQVSVTNVNLFYPGSELAALSNVSLSVSPGETIAILGPSGAGKTSLVDVILGVLPPSNGEVKVSGFSPLLAIQKWPGAISYVPQDVTITNESVKRNIALGYSDVEIDENAINRSINFSRFDVVLENMKFGVETIVGERGTKLSGGQKQRLGIARAIYTNPRLLVLDEATSALDGQTEADISTAIQSLRGEVTVILIAHRLSTARHADKVYYLEEGRIVASGTFDHVRKTVPNFDLQARLMGL